jgi:hypothetical protein
VEFFAVRQPEPSLGNLSAFVGEILVDHQKNITLATPAGVEAAFWAAVGFSDFIGFFLKRPSPTGGAK